jgi:short-subunit dehydrogenase
MTALVRLTRLVLPGMLARRSGRIMNIASAAGFQPTPYMGVYGATKSFVLNFSMSLREEVRGKGPVVTCVCPGPVETEFFDRSGYEQRKGDLTRLAATPEGVARAAYRAMAKGKSVCIPGRFNALTVFLQRFAPLTVVTRIAGRVLGPR